jgi:hypothetical protein
MRQEHVAASNVTAALVLCILNLPRSVGSHEMRSVHKGPSWTKSVADSFVMLMSSTCPLVRRASAEGLALLATCGFNENALTLQTSILASLENTMQGTTILTGNISTSSTNGGAHGSGMETGGSAQGGAPTTSSMVGGIVGGGGKPRRAALETFVLSKSAALLTIGCLRRASVRKAYLDMASSSATPASTRSNSSSQLLQSSSQSQSQSSLTHASSPSHSSPSKATSTRASLPLPTAHMVRRLLNSLRDHHLSSLDTVLTRVYALHALHLLIVYHDDCVDEYDAPEEEALNEERVHLLRTAAQIVQDTFMSIWTAVHNEADKTQEVSNVEFSSLQCWCDNIIMLYHWLYHVQYSTVQYSTVQYRKAVLVYCTVWAGVVYDISYCKMFYTYSMHCRHLFTHSLVSFCYSC